MHSHDNLGRSFSLGVWVNTAYTIIEFIFGTAIGSVALVADAVHNLSDVLSLLVAWIAEKLTHRHPTLKRTYGLKSGSIIAALINAMVLLVAMALIIWEAVMRINKPEAVDGPLVMAVAFVGILVNGWTAIMFMRTQGKDLNAHGAFLHMAADAGVSAVVVVAGGIMTFTNWTWIDPVMSIAVAIVVLVATWGLLKDTCNMVLAAVPRSVDATGIGEIIAQYPTVVSYHDLHIWAISTRDTALTVHLRRSTTADNDAFLSGLSDELRAQGGVDHVTIQVECGDYPELSDNDNDY